MVRENWRTVTSPKLTRAFLGFLVSIDLNEEEEDATETVLWTFADWLDVSTRLEDLFLLPSTVCELLDVTVVVVAEDETDPEEDTESLTDEVREDCLVTRFPAGEFRDMEIIIECSFLWEKYGLKWIKVLKKGQNKEFALGGQIPKKEGFLWGYHI